VLAVFFYFIFLTCPDKRREGGFELVTSASWGVVFNRLSYPLETVTCGIYKWFLDISIRNTFISCEKKITGYKAFKLLSSNNYIVNKKRFYILFIKELLLDIYSFIENTFYQWYSFRRNKKGSAVVQWKLCYLRVKSLNSKNGLRIKKENHFSKLRLCELVRSVMHSSNRNLFSEISWLSYFSGSLRSFRWPMLCGRDIYMIRSIALNPR
jgi:hypothetical protein